jgi:hypothetical protein
VTTTELQGWSLALCDLVEQGASAAAVMFPGGVSLAYSNGQASLMTPRGRTDFSDADLDEVGLVPAGVEGPLLMTGSAAIQTKQP